MKGSLLTAINAMPRVRVRAEPTPEPSTLTAIAEPKPEAPQVEPMPIPDRIEFEPLKFRPSLERPGFGFVEINGARFYGRNVVEALGAAVLGGAFGAFNIEEEA
jgi:hypothetical protein